MMQHWHPGVPRAKGRPRFGNGKTYTPDSTRYEEDVIGWEWASKHGGDLLAGDVAIGMVAVGGGADIDNILKLVLDALNGVAWEDDRQVAHVNAWKLPSGCGLPAGTWLSVHPLPKRWRGRLARWLSRKLGQRAEPGHERQGESEMNDATCCYRYEGYGGKVVDCDADAMWQIWEQPGMGDDYTETCAVHVGPMLELLEVTVAYLYSIPNEATPPQPAGRTRRGRGMT